MKQQMRTLEFISNNLANSLTPGYKATRPVFQGILDGQLNNGAETDQSGAHPSRTASIDFSIAPLMETGGKLDLALEGAGFFVVATPEGIMYTRNGQFSLDKERRLVTSNGFPVMGEGGEITMNGRNITIEDDGSIFVDQIRTSRIKVVDFQDKTQLQNFGMSLYANMRPESPEMTPEKFTVKQGFIESSNVNVTQEMVSMINCLRAYQAGDKAKQSINDAHSRMLTIAAKK